MTELHAGLALDYVIIILRRVAYAVVFVRENSMKGNLEWL